MNLNIPHGHVCAENYVFFSPNPFQSSFLRILGCYHLKGQNIPPPTTSGLSTWADAMGTSCLLFGFKGFKEIRGEKHHPMAPWCCFWLMNYFRSESHIIETHRSTPQLYQYFSEDFECLWRMYPTWEIKLARNSQTSTNGIHLNIILLCVCACVVRLPLSLLVLSCQDWSSECGEGRCSRSSSDICQSYWHMVKWWVDRWQKIHRAVDQFMFAFFHVGVPTWWMSIALTSFLDAHCRDSEHCHVDDIMIQKNIPICDSDQSDPNFGQRFGNQGHLVSRSYLVIDLCLGNTSILGSVCACLRWRVLFRFRVMFEFWEGLGGRWLVPVKTTKCINACNIR